MKMRASVGRVTSTNSRLAKAIYLRRGRGGGAVTSLYWL